jgi:hypothetical protein
MVGDTIILPDAKTRLKRLEHTRNTAARAASLNTMRTSVLSTANAALQRTPLEGFVRWFYLVVISANLRLTSRNH